jgi:hypothetical protein
MAPDDEVDADLDDLDSDWAVPDLWPLHVALAWVLTRDEPFTSRVLRSRLKSIKTDDDSFRLFEIGHAVPPIVADESEAWSQLRALGL